MKAVRLTRNLVVVIALVVSLGANVTLFVGGVLYSVVDQLVDQAFDLDTPWGKQRRDLAECCFADCLTVSFPDCFARQGGRFPGLFGRFDEARAGCRTAVGASSRCAAPALRFGPSGDPPPSARLSASMAVSGAFGHGPIARHIVVASA